MTNLSNVADKYYQRLASAAFAAADYHGGQGCPLYALASTGSLVAGVNGALYRAVRAARDACDIESDDAFCELLTLLTSGELSAEVD